MKGGIGRGALWDTLCGMAPDHACMQSTAGSTQMLHLAQDPNGSDYDKHCWPGSLCVRT